MRAGKKYKVFSSDGLPFGYFLDSRLMAQHIGKLI